jgi:hypothetical protein
MLQQVSLPTDAGQPFRQIMALRQSLGAAIAFQLVHFDKKYVAL